MNRPAAERAWCPKCRRAVLAGLDGDVAGVPVLVEVLPVTREAEVIAFLAGRATFNLDSSRRLFRRGGLLVRSGRRPFGEPVLVGHVCDPPAPAAWFAHPAPAAPQPDRPLSDDDPCPF